MGEWGNPDPSQCTGFESICNKTQPVDEEKFLDIALNETQGEGSAGIESAINILSFVANTTTNLTANATNSFYNVADSIFSTSITATQNATSTPNLGQRLIESLESVANRITLTNGKATVERTNFVQEITQVSAAPPTGFSELSATVTSKGLSRMNIPQVAFNTPQPGGIRVSIGAFSTPDLFPTQNSSSVVSSPIVSITLIAGNSGPLEVSNLATPLTLSIQLNIPKPDNMTRVCVFWDVQSSQWSGSGCSLVGETAEFADCACTHLTAFTTLLQPLVAGTTGTPATPVPILAIVLPIVTGVVAIVIITTGIIALIMHLRRHRRTWDPHDDNGEAFVNEQVIFSNKTDFELVGVSEEQHDESEGYHDGDPGVDNNHKENNSTLEESENAHCDEDTPVVSTNL
jgi:hypothetical protein